MNKLWFPVKLGLFVTTVLGLTALVSCGYQPAYGGARPSARLSVVSAPTRVPEGGALAALLSGLRGELSRAGVLGPGSGYPRVVVEFVRLDERGIGQLPQNSLSGGRDWALARGALVGVTARAWVEESATAVLRDTGDVRRTVSFESSSSGERELIARESALEAAGRATGTALGRRILGEVDVTQEPM